MSERCMHRIGMYECEGEYTKRLGLIATDLVTCCFDQKVSFLFSKSPYQAIKT